MDMTENTMERTVFGKTLRVLLPLLLILCGGTAWYTFKATAPVMKKASPKPQVAIVETQTAQFENVRARVSALGTVAPAKEVTLKAQVAGTVVSVHDRFLPGSMVEKGEILLMLDEVDCQVAVDKAQSTLANARAALAIEQGSQNIAREELRVLGEMTGRQLGQTDLALRKPQLAQALAAVAGAEADLTQAKLNLARTRIAAPFNAMILERSIDVGSFVGAQESLVSLVGTDTFWVKAAIPLDQLAHIDREYPGGCPVRIRSQSSAHVWQGHVIQVTGKLNETSRTALVIVAVDQPLGTRSQPSNSPLMIDDYVQVEITGIPLNNVVVLPRGALKNAGTIWVNKDNRLDIRLVTLAWKDENNVYVKSGLVPGDEVVLSDLATPVQGMALEPVGIPVPDSNTSKTIATKSQVAAKDPS